MTELWVCPRCGIATDDANRHLWGHVMDDGTAADPSHQDVCDWNLYRGLRAFQPDLCNLRCGPVVTE